MASVDFEHVDKVFPDGTRAVVDCTLRIADGELMVFVGPSGCGKSTLLRLLAGLDQVTSGTLRIGDRVVNDLAPQERNVAMVFQDYALYPFMSVRRNLEFPLKMRQLPRDEMQRRVEWAAGLLDITHLLDRLPKQLSGGQRQRVAMGRALVREPTVFLLDEPLSNLDAKLRVQVRAEIGELQQRTGTTMIYVTHDQVEAMTLGDRVAVLCQGALQQVAPPRELYDRPANIFVAGFIGNPPMNLFPTRLSAADRHGATMTVGDQTVPVSVADITDKMAGRDQRLTAGVRPEVFELMSSESAEGGIRVIVEHVEYLGHETLAHVCAGDAPADGAIRLVVRLQGMHEFAKGDVLHLTIEADGVHLFGEDGRALAN
ncbi:MAG TPA: sn-glycerol-3-phosphate ABC transporter ATP-binding protein UgpC [Candidatus Binatia bacterium]